MKKEIRTEKAPLPIGPYSQAVQAGNMLFVAGQIGVDPSTTQMHEGVEAQTRQIMESVNAILKEAGASMDDVVRADIYLLDMTDFAKVNEIYASYFTAPFPARVTVAVSALPKDALVEIAVAATI
ncbi:hypothetical protein GF359_01660 [candidate division WOR-3 bacterium]|uniref:RidA family protein n=1 Tax=candidate division WOR-3 bacterium TaxID=2052148 RepID=A0A9D5QDB8_UNCW3|nr:hypothetical protein [candidate division WOR-3 bacterium]MBD3363900.1 hypothetical protein [candidate division WOR-3 bacterium]